MALSTFCAKLTAPRWISATNPAGGLAPQSAFVWPRPQSTSGLVMPLVDVAGANSIGNAAYVLPPIVAKASRPSVRGNDDRLSTPGATTSSCAPVFENDASWFLASTAPTVRTLWYAPGNETFFEASLPDATTISVPAL